MKLNVVSIEKELVRIQAEGDITTHDFTADGRNPFEAVLGSRWASHQVLVDLRGVPFLDSSAIGWLMASRRECERGGGLVVLHSIQPRVRQVLDLLHVGRAVPIVENEAAALTVIAAAAAGLRVQSASKAPAAKAQTAKTSTGKPRRAKKAA
jgi:anti-anti-sigma factor